MKNNLLLGLLILLIGNVTAQSINMTAPIDGTPVNTGENLNFSWSANETSGTLHLLISTDGGSNYFNIDQSLAIDASWGSFDLPVGHEIPSGTYYFKLVDASNYAIESNVRYAINTDVAFVASPLILSPLNNASSVDITLSNTIQSGKIGILFGEAISLGVDKEIHLKSDDPASDVTFNTDNANVSIAQYEGNDLILLIEPTLPLLNEVTYYITMEEGAVKDLSGNAFAGFSSAGEWQFTTGEAITISGKIEYDGVYTGDLIGALYYQSDFKKLDFSLPLDALLDEDPAFPYNYSFNALIDSTYAVLTFRDINDNGAYDKGEPLDYIQDIIISGSSITGQDMRLEEPVNIDAVFNLDESQSTWTLGEDDGTFTSLEGGYYSTPTKNGITAWTGDSHTMTTDLFGIGFWINETDRGDLAGSWLDAGAVLHLEYTFPIEKNINFIALAGTVNSMVIVDETTHKRLILDLTIADPVHSASGDMGASCGFTISCSPVHSGGVNCYGTIFYNDMYSVDVNLTVSQNTDLVGLRANGVDGVQGQFTALMSDDFLVNELGVDANNMPATSSLLSADIPDLEDSEFDVVNNFAAITSGFDTDGDGIDNRIYKVVLNNSKWSAHDILFGGQDYVTLQQEISNQPLFTVSSDYVLVHSFVHDLQILSVNGTSVVNEKNLSPGFSFSISHLNKGLYLIKSDHNKTVTFVK